MDSKKRKTDVNPSNDVSVAGSLQLHGLTLTNFRREWKKEDSSRDWTLATLMRPDEEDRRAMGEESEGGRGEVGDEGRDGGKS